jgi:ATP-dependent exoDNAse (exonuclease V) alpha subunit
MPDLGKAEAVSSPAALGSGKTTIVNSILRILAAKEVSLLQYVPTARAAKRMSDAKGLEAKSKLGEWLMADS